MAATKRALIMEPGVLEALEDALKQTATMESAAGAIGASAATLRNWRKLGEDYRAHLTAGGEADARREPYLRFVEMWEASRALRLRAAENSIVRAFTPRTVRRTTTTTKADGSVETRVEEWEDFNWKPAMAYLERFAPDEWRRRVEVEGTITHELAIEPGALDAIRARMATMAELEAGDVADAEVVEPD